MKKFFTLLTAVFFCLSIFAQSAQTTKTITWGGTERQYIEYVPANVSSPAPVLFVFHGLGDDMANMAKLEAGVEAVKKERFALSQLLIDVADRFADKCSSKGLKIEIETKSDAVQPVSDRNRLFEILSQYVDNALKFTEKGVVTLGYQVHDDLLHIWVRDTGKGIPANHCNDHLFGRFVKIDEFVPGSGLGLSICRSMALSIGGKVGVESKVNVGSLFWVEIPLSEVV